MTSSLGYGELLSLRNVLLAYAITALLLLTRHYLKKRSISYLRGPPNTSWLLGNAYELRHQANVGDIEFQWFREYGSVLHTKSCYGEDILTIADPKALQYIFHTSGYNFPKTNDTTYMLHTLFGDGLVAVSGQIHQRQRKVMMPAFSVPQLRTFLGIFQQLTRRLGLKWKGAIQEGSNVVNVHLDLGKLTLDIVGQTAFNYDFEALEDGKNELAEELHTLFFDSNLKVTRMELLAQQLYRWLPNCLLRPYTSMLTSRQSTRFRRFQHLAGGIGRKMLAEQTAEGAAVESSQKDVLSVLIRANIAEDPSQRLSDDEVAAQVATLIFTGHDTTASTVTWILWELAWSPKDQARLRTEIAETRARKVGDAEFTSDDYDSMVFLNAIIKEGLRLHPILPQLDRVTSKDEVIPLSTSITTKDGRLITEIPVSKGQTIQCSLAGYNRLASVWGDDADTWLPERFMNTYQTKAETSLGLVANLMSFSAGVRGCIGWRFAVIEMQCMLVELIDTFEFSLPDSGLDIQRLPVGLMVPIVQGQPEKGSQMPLKIALVEARQNID